MRLFPQFSLRLLPVSKINTFPSKSRLSTHIEPLRCLLFELFVTQAENRALVPIDPLLCIRYCKDGDGAAAEAVDGLAADGGVRGAAEAEAAKRVGEDEDWPASPPPPPAPLGGAGGGGGVVPLLPPDELRGWPPLVWLLFPPPFTLPFFRLFPFPPPISPPSDLGTIPP